ncbi:MAG: hypothetical protein IPI44_14245 [Sulfuritalea sp.]|nr:hypothetical protein [Sulfuritalea sp.]
MPSSWTAPAPASLTNWAALSSARFIDSSAPNFVVHEMSGTGDVKECLSGVDLGTDGIIGKGENFDLGLSPNGPRPGRPTGRPV